MDHCESWSLCKNNMNAVRTCPKLTEQTSYICKYISLQSLFSPPVYPYPGTWLDQPEWFNNAYAIAKNKLNSMNKK